MAVNAYDKALSLNPDLVVAYHNRGMVKITLGQWEAALADYDAAIARKPDYAEAYYSRAFVKEVLDQREAALADYDAAIAREARLYPSLLQPRHGNEEQTRPMGRGDC